MPAMRHADVLTIREARAAIRSGTLSVSELLAGCLRAVDRLDKRLNVFVDVQDRDTLLDQARAVDGRRGRADGGGLLEGIPIGLKDIYLSKDLPTTASSKILAGNHPRRDSATVERLRNAGAIFVGKTQTHEFAYGPTTVNEYAGASRNPWDENRVPGGSSGGSAIAVATGMCLGATATDTGGSIRHPAAFCGVTGLKPTYGLVSRRGIIPLAWSLDHAGPIARSVDDVAHLLQVMAGHDPLDPGSASVTVPNYVESIRQPPGPLVIGLPRNYYFDALEPDIRKAFFDALKVLEGFGWRIEEVSLPHLKYALGAELAIISAEASAYHRKTMQARAGDYSSDVRKELDSGMIVPAVDYLLAQRVRRRIADDFAAALSTVDMLATPATPIVAPLIGQEEVELEGRMQASLDAIWHNAFPTNLTGSPTLCLPCGFSQQGLPIALQLIGRNFDELTLLRSGHLYQQHTDWHRRLPPA
jgi:aspartyl-tRNA(Asn)/glutamyl-tRNA(Gln) amidotransferase subunit A